MKQHNKNFPNNYSLSKSKNSRVYDEFQVSKSSCLDHPPVWQFKAIDIDHEQWGWKNLKSQTLSVLEKLKSYETRLWKEIRADKKRDHPVPITHLESDARKRLKELGLNDVDELFRLRLNGEQRVWGILEGYIFKILWWDPEHSVCPSVKKHT